MVIGYSLLVVGIESPVTDVRAHEVGIRNADVENRKREKDKDDRIPQFDIRHSSIVIRHSEGSSFQSFQLSSPSLRSVALALLWIGPIG